MWISDRLGRRAPASAVRSAAVAKVGDGVIATVGAQENSGVRLASCAGIEYVPEKGAQAIVINAGGRSYCLGILQQPDPQLAEGELKLSSAGGASIVLKNDGRVLINGKEVT